MPFFRSLGPGDEGNDVLQLKQILLAAGDDPGPMTPLFTEQTQFALAQWQAQHNYPNAVPATPQSVTVALEQGTGYTLGDDVSAGLIIGPPADADRLPFTRQARIPAILDPTPVLSVTPVLTIQSEDDRCLAGHAGHLCDQRVGIVEQPITVNLTSERNGRFQDIVTPPVSRSSPSGDTSTTVIRADPRQHRGRAGPHCRHVDRRRLGLLGRITGVGADDAS